MAFGSGKNQEDTEIKESVELLCEREELKAAAAASAEPPPLATQYKFSEVEVHGASEAGDRDHSTATAAAAAERKGEDDTLSLSPRVRAVDKPPLPPRPPFVSRARGPSSAGGKPPGPMTDQKAEAEGLPRKKNEQVIVCPKKEKKQLWRKCRIPAGRNTMILVLLILTILLLPTGTEGFQHFENIEDAAERLAELNNLGDIRLQLEEETPGPGLTFCASPVIIAICTFLILGLASWFIDPNQEQ